MEQDTVRARLAELHAELEDAHQNNPAAAEHLGKVLPDVKRVAEGGTEQDASLAGRLEKVAVQFEADHPSLAGSVRRLVDLLAEVGI